MATFKQFIYIPVYLIIKFSSSIHNIYFYIYISHFFHRLFRWIWRASSDWLRKNSLIRPYEIIHFLQTDYLGRTLQTVFMEMALLMIMSYLWVDGKCNHFIFEIWMSFVWFSEFKMRILISKHSLNSALYLFINLLRGLLLCYATFGAWAFSRRDMSTAVSTATLCHLNLSLDFIFLFFFRQWFPLQF